MNFRFMPNAFLILKPIQTNFREVLNTFECFLMQVQTHLPKTKCVWHMKITVICTVYAIRLILLNSCIKKLNISCLYRFCWFSIRVTANEIRSPKSFSSDSSFALYAVCTLSMMHDGSRPYIDLQHDLYRIPVQISALCFVPHLKLLTPPLCNICNTMECVLFQKYLLCC